jgi:hypothetical protein
MSPSLKFSYAKKKSMGYAKKIYIHAKSIREKIHAKEHE